MLAEILGVVGVFGSSLLSAMHFYNPWGLNFNFTLFLYQDLSCVCVRSYFYSCSQPDPLLLDLS